MNQFYSVKHFWDVGDEPSGPSLTPLAAGWGMGAAE